MDETQHKLALPKGTRIGDFEFHRVLGHGGFGITYLGWNLALDIPVAIKEYLPSDLATRESDLSVVAQSSQAAADFQWGLDRFIDEARILARFQHPNIVRVHHFFSAHSTAYIVMEYAEGETLSDFLNRKGVLTEAELKAILHPILDGLEAVHRADFLHRDIKPGNIIIRDEDDSPVLLDFGAARLAIGAKSRSVTSVVTPGYAPREQYSSRGNQGPWTDIYALGGVCYRALTADVPTDAVDRMIDDPLIPVSERCKGRASHPFLAAIDHALQVDESDRPQSASEWRAELGDAQEIARPPKTESSPPPVDDTAIKEYRKSRGKVLWAVVGMLALLAVAGVVIYDPVERVRLAEERNKFVAEVGREPSLHGVNPDGDTDLHIAVRLNLSTLTRSLLSQGANIHTKTNNENGDTPLHTAARNNVHQMVKVLLDSGANILAKNNYGGNPLHVAAFMNAHETAAILLKHGAYVNAKDKNGWTPLHDAAYENAHEIAGVLLKHGTDANAKEEDGWTPLHIAAAYNNAPETAEVLLKHSADVNVKSKNGSTPLHLAAYRNAHETAGVLLKHSADINAKNNDGWTPLYIAEAKDAHETAEVLLKHGADVH